MIKWHQRIQKVADTKSSPSTLIQKSIVFELFHSGKRFQKVPFSWIFLCGYKRISVDRRCIRNNKVAFSNLSGIVWTGPKLFVLTFDSTCDWQSVPVVSWTRAWKSFSDAAIRLWEMHVLYNSDGVVKYSVIHRLRLINSAQLRNKKFQSKCWSRNAALFITYYTYTCRQCWSR